MVHWSSLAHSSTFINLLKCRLRQQIFRITWYVYFDHVHYLPVAFVLSILRILSLFNCQSKIGTRIIPNLPGIPQAQSTNGSSNGTHSGWEALTLVFVWLMFLLSTSTSALLPLKGLKFVLSGKMNKVKTQRYFFVSYKPSEIAIAGILNAFDRLKPQGFFSPNFPFQNTFSKGQLPGCLPLRQP